MEKVNLSMLLWMVQEFKLRGLTEIVVVYDYDDIFWPLLETVCRRLGIDFQRAGAIFKIKENPLLTHEEQEAIIAAFADPAFFQNIQFFPGIADITKILELGAELKINSNAFNAAISNLKTDQLLAAVPDLRPEQIQMNIIDHSISDRKPVDPRTIIFHDDSPHNILKAKAILNSMPEQPAWTHEPHLVNTFKQDLHRQVIWCPDLQAMNQMTYEVVDFIVKEGNIHVSKTFASGL